MAAALHRVLVVDDEKVVADTLALIFSQSGYESRAVYNSEQAEEIFAEWPPDLVVIDIILPGSGGIALATLVRRQFPACRVLLLSGLAETRKNAEIGGYTFTILQKPLHPTEILDVVKQLLIDGTVPAWIGTRKGDPEKS